jgi:hypothetical protein
MFPRVALTALLGVALSGAALAQDEGASSPVAGGALLESCANHKFETTVTAMVNGKPRNQKVKICGIAGQTEAAWKRTLEDAVEKVEANEKMAASVKEQIVTALRLEIGRLGLASVAPPASGSLTPLVDRLAPIPTKPVAAAPLTPVRPATRPTPRPLERDYGNLKPLPPPLPPAAAAAMATTRLPALARPRFQLLCSSQQDPRGTEECDDLYPSTVFTIRAEETLAGDTSLRFLRKGDERGDVTLAALRKGQAMRVPLPRGVCAGITRGSVEIQVMRKAPTGARQVVDALGPYDLRC